jgi:hypothetical protein
MPVGVWHVFPNISLSRNSYLSVNFIEGNPSQALACLFSERVVPAVG